jgi:hypothetical protein
MDDDEKFEDFYSNAERRIRELNKKRDDAMNETPQKIYAKIGELIGTLTLDGEAYPIKGLSDKTAQSLHRTVCPNCGAPHSPWEAKCEYCGGYFDLKSTEAETQQKCKPYAVTQWDGEKFVSKVVNPMERVKTKKLPTKNIIG